MPRKIASRVKPPLLIFPLQIHNDNTLLTARTTTLKLLRAVFQDSEQILMLIVGLSDLR